MPRWLKITITAVVILTGLLVAGMTTLIDLKEQPEYCARCHQRPNYASWAASSFLANEHAQAAIRCQTCHPRTLGDSLREITSYVRQGGEFRVRSNAVKVNRKQCVQCHEHNSYTQLIPLTTDFERNPHDGHWPNMNCNICHKMHKKSIDYCSKCHPAIIGGIDADWTSLSRE